jgi:predicted  nucleic acid-binding Zn-ribbon protein
MGVPKPQYDQLKQKNNNLNLQINDHLDMIRERDAKLKAQQKRIEEQEKEILAMKTAVE